jgi:hypothetical protein
VLPTLPEQPDALHLAAELVRRQAGEDEATDAAMRAASDALLAVDQIARQARAAIARVEALCDDAAEYEANQPHGYDALAGFLTVDEVRAALRGEP